MLLLGGLVLTVKLDTLSPIARGAFMAGCLSFGLIGVGKALAARDTTIVMKARECALAAVAFTGIFYQHTIYEGAALLSLGALWLIRVMFPRLVTGFRDDPGL